MSNYDGGEDPVYIGKGKTIGDSEKRLKLLTDDHGVLWVPRKGIHDNSEVWRDGQPKGKIVLKLWAAELKNLA